MSASEKHESSTARPNSDKTIKRRHSKEFGGGGHAVHRSVDGSFTGNIEQFEDVRPGDIVIRNRPWEL